ncbi:hypothetical protein [Gilvimarinus sp. 1_MG-2023]|uniref:hypothetical protein n=1 Tax=Gilvimarinus sp. 1_MG-2023 TaxID=3062638 RepID=UPI0026E189D0|nr:hypothetical protein [Gilvimarinus sp. 1_MG-2023]MDO6747216.1 hypothetical protein [Gilvimarinus sp. 1_MG-2023]
MAGDYKLMIQRDDTDHLSGRNAVEGSVTITFDDDTLTDANGVLSGDGNGTVNYSRGVALVRPSDAPAPENNSYSVDFDQFNGPNRQSVTITPVQSSITETLTGGAIKPGSVRISCNMKRFREYLKHEHFVWGVGAVSSA